MGNSHSRRKRRNKFSTGQTSLSSLSSSTSSSSSSSSSSSHRLSNRADQSYHIPQTYDELDRLQQQVFVFQYIFQSRFSAPIEEILETGGNVLDIGCGPGTWLLDMATVYTQSQFFGVDCIKCFPIAIKPFNVTFYQENLMDGLSMRDGVFDYVRLSLMLMSFVPGEYLQVIQEAIRVLRPGGYIEICDVEFILEYGSPMVEKLMRTFHSMLAAKGIDVQLLEKIPAILASTNQLTHIKSEVRKIPIGARGGKKGGLSLQNLSYYFSVTIAELMSEHLGMSLSEYERFWEGAREELEGHENRTAYCRFWAQKI